jgi:hypothetical protein
MNQDETPRSDYPAPPQSDPEPPVQQGYDGYPQQGNVYAGPPPARPGFDFQDLWARWRSVLYPPSVAAFDMQKPAANWNTIFISLAILGVVQGVFAYITGLEYNRSGTGYGTIIGGFIGAFIGFFITVGLIYLLARLLGGTGEFLEHAWLLSLVWVPIQAASAVIGIIPVLGGIVQLALAIYGLVLYIYATSSAQRITLGRATVAVLIPGIVLAVIVLILLAIAAAFLIGLGMSVPFR